MGAQLAKEVIVLGDSTRVIRFTHNEYEFPARRENFIGKGAFGSVWKGYDQNRTPVAMKKVPKDEFENSRDEVRILGSLLHPNLVNMLGFAMDVCDAYIIMEFCERDLRSLLEIVGKFVNENITFSSSISPSI